MARFKFSLEALLKVKKLKKRQAEGEYARAQKELDRQQAILSELADEYRGVVSELDRMTANGTNVYRMKMYSDYSDLLWKRIKSQQQIVARAMNDLDAAKSELIGLIKEVNVLSEMKERQYYQYRLEVEKKYQKVVDEYSSYKIYSRQGGLINGEV